MMQFNYWAVILAAVSAFIASAIWYMVFAKARASLSPAAATAGRPRPGQILIEFARNVLLTLVLAHIILRMDITTATGVALLAVLLWIGFPVILLTGSVMYEKVPWKLAAIHAGDWLIKLLLVTFIIQNWF
jgi:hypothetical protein